MFKRWFKPARTSSLIIGPRRSGKTTFLKESFPNYQYITLDDLDQLTWANRDPKGFVENLSEKVVVDELQRAPKLTVALKKRIDEGNILVQMTGSSSIGLLDKTADSLAGRIDLRHFPTACWGERDGAPTHRIFEEQVELPQLKTAQRGLERAVVFGGFPEIVANENSDERRELLKRYRDTYFTRDLAQLSNIENVEGILAILQHLGNSIGSLVEISNFAQESGLSHPTAKKYLNVLTQSELAFKLYGYHFGPAKRYIASAKMYFCDSGIPTALNQQLAYGQVIENFVISELEKRRKLGFFKSEQFFYYRSTSNLEIDLLFTEQKTISAIEIKASPRIAKRDLTNLKSYLRTNTKHQIKAFLFYLGEEYLELDGVSCIPIAALYRGN